MPIPDNYDFSKDWRIQDMLVEPSVRLSIMHAKRYDVPLSAYTLTESEYLMETDWDPDNPVTWILRFGFVPRALR